MYLRNIGKQTVHITDKSRGKYLLKNNIHLQYLDDVSGGSLVQVLSKIPHVDSSAFNYVTPSAGFDTDEKCELESRVLAQTMKDGGVIWANSGSDAVEAAIWALNTHNEMENGCPIENYLVRRGGYHGNTFLTRLLSCRTVKEDKVSINFNDRINIYYLDDYDVKEQYQPYNSVNSVSSANYLLERLKGLKDRQYLQGSSLLILEVFPTTGYSYTPMLEHYIEIVEWCKNNKIYVLFDEVASGMYRHGFCSISTDNNFYSLKKANDNFTPDACVFSKGLTSGAYPISCAVINKSVASTLTENNIRPVSFTYSMTHAAAAFSNKILDEISNMEERGYFSERGEYINNLFQEVNEVFKSKYNNEVGMQYTSTSLRLDLNDSLCKELSKNLLDEKIIIYTGNAYMKKKKDYEQRFFLHYCPPFDVDEEKTLILYKKYISALKKTFE